MSGIEIAGTGSYLPSLVLTNDDLSKMVDTSDEWIRERTGIRERRISKGEPAWYMGRQAAAACLENAGVGAKDVDLIIACSITADYFTPSLSCIIQSEIGADNAFCYDMNAACSGFIYAVDAAYRYLETGGAKTVLVVCSEVLSKIIDFTDRSTCVLFGDGAAAAVLKKGENKLFSSYLRAEGSSGASLLSRSIENKSPFFTEADREEYRKFGPTNGHFLAMAGREVYRFATKALAESVEKACEKAGLAVNRLDLIVPHQANIRIVKTAADRLGGDMDKMYVNLDRFGNTSCASIPICLDELNRSGKLRRGMKIAIAGFGAGLTCGAVVMEW